MLPALPAGTVALVLVSNLAYDCAFASSLKVCLRTCTIGPGVWSARRRRSRSRGWRPAEWGAAAASTSTARASQGYVHTLGHAKPITPLHVSRLCIASCKQMYTHVHVRTHIYTHICTHSLQGPLAPGGGARHAALRLPRPARGTHAYEEGGPTPIPPPR